MNKKIIKTPMGNIPIILDENIKDDTVIAIKTNSFNYSPITAIACTTSEGTKEYEFDFDIGGSITASAITTTTLAPANFEFFMGNPSGSFISWGDSTVTIEGTIEGGILSDHKLDKYEKQIILKMKKLLKLIPKKSKHAREMVENELTEIKVGMGVKKRSLLKLNELYKKYKKVKK